jgi:hypothetical protein
MANWALDHVMKLIQIKCEDMNFPKTQMGWARTLYKHAFSGLCKKIVCGNGIFAMV